MTSPTTNETRVAVTVAEAAKAATVSRSTIYAELAAGRIKARKLGRRTLVEVASLRDWVSALPAYEPKAA